MTYPGLAVDREWEGNTLNDSSCCVRSSSLRASVDVWYFSISWKGRYGCHSIECLALHFYLHDRKVPQRTETSTVPHEVCLAQCIPDLTV